MERILLGISLGDGARLAVPGGGLGPGRSACGRRAGEKGWFERGAGEEGWFERSAGGVGGAGGAAGRGWGVLR
ncbi:hypothetical protein [Streptomyces sp. NPDC127108]|uniref:hypothetical protein n=1 Tax=Streptomyces sp. NPDC127108 TaxID=3345361 RepID=UPI00363A6A7B